MKNFSKLALLSSILLSTGCATIVSDSYYPVAIQSNPSGAEFTITNRKGDQIASGITPQTIVLPAGSGYFKGEKYVINYKKGKVKKSVLLDSTIDGWYLGGNLLFGGLIGYLIVDPISGAMFKLPPSVDADLSSNKSSLKIMSIDDLTAEQKSQLEPINL